MAAKASKPAPGFSAFISHAKADAKKAKAIADGLEKRGFKCWIAPRDVKAGRAYGDEIIRGIESAKAFVLVLSKASNDSAFVAREVERAVSKKKPILAVRLADIEPAPALELFISGTQWIDAFPGRLAPHIGRLADLLADDAGVAAPEPMPAPEPHWLRKWALPLGTATAVLLVVGAGLALLPDRRLPLLGPKADPAVLTEPAWQKEYEQIAAAKPLDDAATHGAWSSNDSEVVRGRDATSLPDDPDVQYCDKGSGTPAIAACDRAIYSKKFSSAVLAILHNDRGYLYMMSGDLDRGRADFDRAIEIDPDGYHPYWNRAEIFRKQGDRDRALMDYVKALSLNPNGDDRPKIEASLQALGGATATQESDPTVITTPHWGDPGGGTAAASVPALSFPPAVATMPASPPLAVTPALPAAPAPMPVR